MITVLEPTLGATAKKATLRLTGTVVGGCVACAILACAESANGGRRAQAAPPFRPLAPASRPTPNTRPSFPSSAGLHSPAAADATA